MKKVFLTLLPVFLISLHSFAQNTPKRIEAENFNASHVATTKEGDKGIIVNKFSKNAWIRFDNLDFGEGTEQIKFRIGGGSPDSSLEIRVGDQKGKVIATFKPETTNWRLSEQIVQIPKLTGKQTITLIAPANGILLNWFEY